MHTLRPLALFALCAGLTAGCSDGVPKLNKTNVSGKVTLNGKPIDQGVITFSLGGEPPSTIDIRNGQYAGQAAVGSNKVTISSKRPTAGKTGNPDMERRMKAQGQTPEEEIVPAAYNKDSKEMRVVEQGGANQFDFDIKGDAKGGK